MRNILSSTSIAALALAFPAAALADVTNTQTISSGQHGSLDAGTIVSSGGDLAFTGTSITPQGTAEFNSSYGAGGATLYGILIQATLEEASSYNVIPITGSSLVVGEVFGVFTSGSNYAKVLILAVSSNSLTIEYYTYEAATGNTPTITAVQDAGSYTANIAEGSMFVVKGTNLSASGFFQFGFPLPTTSNGVQIAFTPAAGGTPTNAYLVYLYNQGGVNQLAAILPSTLAA